MPGKRIVDHEQRRVDRVAERGREDAPERPPPVPTARSRSRGGWRRARAPASSSVRAVASGPAGLRQLEPARGGRVGDERALRARAGEDEDAPATERAQRRERLERLEQLGNRAGSARRRSARTARRRARRLRPATPCACRRARRPSSDGAGLADGDRDAALEGTRRGRRRSGGRRAALEVDADAR